MIAYDGVSIAVHEGNIGVLNNVIPCVLRSEKGRLLVRTTHQWPFRINWLAKVLEWLVPPAAKPRPLGSTLTVYMQPEGFSLTCDSSLEPLVAWKHKRTIAHFCRLRSQVIFLQLRKRDTPWQVRQTADKGEQDRRNPWKQERRRLSQGKGQKEEKNK